MFLLPDAWFVGGLLGSTVNPRIGFPVPAVSFLLLGARVAADISVPDAAVYALAIGLGLVHGFLNGIALGGLTAGSGLVGVMAVIFVHVTLVSAMVLSLRRPYAQIVVRVAGSWVAAVGLLMFGWAMR